MCEHYVQWFRVQGASSQRGRNRRHHGRGQFLPWFTRKHTSFMREAGSHGPFYQRSLFSRPGQQWPTLHPGEREVPPAIVPDRGI